MELKGKIALVTGSSRGIGSCIALKLAEQGANVVVNYLSNHDAAKKIVNEIRVLGRDSISVQADVSKINEVKKLFQETIKYFGTLDILVNNAGTTSPTMVEDMPEEEWKRVIDVNLTAVFLCCKEAIKVMKPRKKGKIVNISSVAGLKMAYFSGAHYTASKYGVNGFTRHLAYELAPYGVNVNAVCPGATSTSLLLETSQSHVIEKMEKEFIPTGRLTTPEELADAVLFLVSERTNSIVGITLPVDGGSILGWEPNEAYERQRKD